MKDFTKKVFCRSWGQFLVLCSMIPLILFSGCSMKPAPASGFLGDYSQFKTLKEGEPLSVDKHAGRGLQDYSKIMIDPLEVNFHAKAKGKNIPLKTLDNLLDYFHGALLKEVKDSHWILVEQPGEDVVRLRVALTDVAPSMQILNLAVTSTASGLGTGWAAMEAEFVDSVTGERVLALADQRKGNRAVYFRGWSRWGHTRNVFNQWARLLIKDSPQL